MPLFERKDDGPLFLFPSLKAVVRARYASSTYSAGEKAKKTLMVGALLWLTNMVAQPVVRI